MNPTSNETPGLSLPTPVERPVQPVGSVETPILTPIEQAPPAQEASQRVAQSYASTVPAQQQGSNGDAPAATDVSNTSTTATNTGTDDQDLIDKAVVSKAKSIVARTAEDPYKQTQEMSALKAEFLQETYNKSLKLSP